VNPWKVILAAAVIFVCGMVSGALLFDRHDKPNAKPGISTTNSIPPWQSQRIEFLRRIEKHLNLTQVQREKIEKILRESQERTKPLWDQITPQLRDESRRTREAIRAELTSEQQKTFEKFFKPRYPRRMDDDEKARRAKSRPEQTPATNNNTSTKP
jgi:Spy/CpxP family protein refolding chaperone